MEKAYVKWVQGIHRPTGGLAEFKRFIRQQRSNTVKRLQRERYDEGKAWPGLASLGLTWSGLSWRGARNNFEALPVAEAFSMTESSRFGQAVARALWEGPVGPLTTRVLEGPAGLLTTRVLE